MKAFLHILGTKWHKAVSTTSSGTTRGYPLYDVHGNMVATVSTMGTAWNIVSGSERSYDVWGGVRSGAATGGPKGRYCANLGHVQDDESGLIYMRARYYEPSTGRFISEDPAMDGKNWYIYCHNSPINLVDKSGTEADPHYPTALEQQFILGMVGAFSTYVVGILSMGIFCSASVAKYALKGAFALIATVLTQMLVSLSTGPHDQLDPEKYNKDMMKKIKGGAVTGAMAGIATAIAIYLGARSGLMLAQIWEMDYVDNI